jgi:hypothetical protein
VKRIAWLVALTLLMAHGALLWSDVQLWYPRWDFFAAKARAQEAQSAKAAAASLPQTAPAVAPPPPTGVLPVAKPRVRKSNGTHFSDEH